MQVRRTVRDLRRHNRSVLLSSLYLGEPQSRQDLGRSSGLSQGTVSNVVGELIEEGLQDYLADYRVKLAEKMNKQLDKKRDKLRIPLLHARRSLPDPVEAEARLDAVQRA